MGYMIRIDGKIYTENKSSICGPVALAVPQMKIIQPLLDQSSPMYEFSRCYSTLNYLHAHFNLL